jgi:hypothetical protein
MDFKTAKIYTEFDMCVEAMNAWREDASGTAYDTLEQIKYRFSDLTKEQIKMVFEEVESGYIWDIETDEIKHEEEEEEPICCVGCGKDGVFPKNRDGDTMCESCHSDGEEEEEESDEESDEEESDEDSNIVFNCSGCDRAIVRDSIAHDNCITKDGKKWYCLDCFDLCEYESDQDEL